jgi:serine/threonine protein kinase
MIMMVSKYLEILTSFWTLDEVWDKTSDGAKDLVSKLLCHVKNRYTAKEALAHPWLVKHTKYSREFELSGDVLRRISTFSSVNKM